MTKRAMTGLERGWRVPVLERALNRILFDDGCWEWEGSKTRDGYGQIEDGRRSDRHNLRAHRVVYEGLRGPIPEGLDLDHLCRNRGCVRPDHLKPVTRSENCRRGMTGRYDRSPA